ncbi:uncharacterized protein Z520_02300 [Fonsecaea multimorphosa CBS 102226]|uniref:Benzoate 4-monooxygenase cytochrome P450 n=1 Tax=Fonsecaea multimorphosa CBS 102226 TaxID=1442371 RepID=A0A0D2IYN6_9EURO|nr:uncharacterized protein Z520_02300 [Fonsecaea multimorphosa CBS 102226]KIY02162.1 hypothetical protein Z520_02300 [Fonsecaea multimorphosa CBS 102226]
MYKRRADVNQALGLVIYRLFFHALSKYPGPFLAKITGLHPAYHALIGDRHLYVYKQHQKYGDVVRVAPNIVSINKAEALRDIYGVNRNVQKGFVYDVVTHHAGFPSTFSSTDRAMHARKRRALAPGFTDAALRDMEDFVLNHVRAFIQKIGPSDGESARVVDMGLWCNYLTFDVMADVAFGKDFGMLERKELRDIPHLVNAAGHRSLISGSSQLIFRLGLDKYMARDIVKNAPKLIRFVRQTLTERIASKSERKDFVHYMLKAQESGKGYETKELMADCRSMVIAGSDTTATQMAANFYHLTRNPETMKRLTAEIRSTFSKVEEIQLGKALENCEYLKAVVEETLRMNPSLPGYLPRQVLPGGIDIDGEYYPPGVEVAVTTWALHHDPRYFDQPHQHNPSRWLAAESGEDNVKRAMSAFAPFSYGSRICIGRRLAYIEIWVTLARTVFLYDFKYISGGREDSLGSECDEYRMLDNFSAARDGPLIEVRRRQDCDLVI